MRLSKCIHLVQAHAEGEIGKVVVGGILNIPGATIGDKLDYINHKDDSLRRFLLNEPRGKTAMSVNLILPAQNPEADIAHIVLQQDKAHATSGSNSICVVTVLLETGMIEPKEEIVIETASGLVRCKPDWRDGRCHSVGVSFPSCFFVEEDVIHSKTYGDIRYEIAFGGIFYALVDIQQLGMEINPENAPEIVCAGMSLLKDIQLAKTPKHPETESLNYFSYLMFYDETRAGEMKFKHCTVLPPGRIDRSPCGTGSSARAACLYAKNRLNKGDIMIAGSAIDTEFRVQITGEKEYFGYQAIVPQITGRAWIYGTEQIGVDPSDPFQQGYLLTNA